MLSPTSSCKFYFVYWIFSILIITIKCDSIKNVVLLVADDAAFEMGAYLNRYCQTPNLDALAKKGLIFNNAYTSVSSCSPSRAQILTGLPSHQSGMYGLHQGVHHFNVFDKVTSLPNILSKKSIYTGIIGKKHVGARSNFQFDYEQTEENHSINQIGRNITKIKLYVREFLKSIKNINKGLDLDNVDDNLRSDESKPFFLVVAFHDPHRCGHITPQYGEFCERWGSGELGMGTIPDWKPIYYDWRNFPSSLIQNLPDTDIARQETAAQYMTISRLDQGIGLVVKEIEAAGFGSNSLIIYTSDNGPPFPGGRTNLYDYGVREPMIISSPEDGTRRNSVTNVMTSLLDIFPTVLDAFKINNGSISNDIGSKSLLPLLKNEPTPSSDEVIFGSQNFHEITMNYPMRMIRTRQYKLIHNINYQSYFPVDQDLYTSPTFQQILNLTMSKEQLPWKKTLKGFYERPEWEMYDLKVDPLEQWNIAEKPKFKDIRVQLEKRLLDWQRKTNDPWICAPHGVLEAQGQYKNNPVCLTLGHESINPSLFKKHSFTYL